MKKTGNYTYLRRLRNLTKTQTIRDNKITTKKLNLIDKSEFSFD